MAPLVKSSSNSSLPPDQSQIKLKEPRRILHFSDGTLEEYSTDEEADQVDNSNTRTEAPSAWIPWMWYATTNAGYRTLEICDSMGEYLANMLGITSSKYFAEIEYYRESLQAKTNEAANSGTVELGTGRPSVNI